MSNISCCKISIVCLYFRYHSLRLHHKRVWIKARKRKRICSRRVLNFYRNSKERSSKKNQI